VARDRDNEASGGSQAPEQPPGGTPQARRSVTERHDVAFVAGAVVGAVAGSTAALFRAPQAGQRTREQLAGYASVASQRANDLGARIGRSGGQAAGALRSRGASLGPRTRVEMRPATVVRSEPAPVPPGTPDAVAAAPVPAASVAGIAEQPAEPISGLDPAIALTPDLAGTGTATSSIGPEVADEERVLDHEAPLSTDR